MVDEVIVRFERTEALEVLALVQATINVMRRSSQLAVGEVLLTGARERLISALEEDR